MKSGRTHLSKGFLKDAKKIAIQNINTLSQYSKSGTPIIGQEPSEILTLRDEYLDLCETSQLDDAIQLGKNSFMFEEFLAKHFLEHPKDTEIFNGNRREVHFHGHCHAKALVGIQPMMEVLSKTGFNPIDLKTGCCGMAGSFGYEKNHYETSLAVGELTLFPKLRAVEDDAIICAHGFSCRHQISDGISKKAKHTAVILYESMSN